MNERILKGKQVQEGDHYEIEVRQVIPDPTAGQFSRPDTEAEETVEHVDLEEYREAEAAANREELEALAREMIGEAETVAKGIVDKAEQDAAELRDKAESEIAALRDRADRELAEEREKLEKTIRDEISTEYRDRYLKAVTALEQAARQLQASADDYLREIQSSAFNTVLEISRQLIGREPSRDPSFIAGLIAQAFILLKPQTVAHVFLNPALFHVLSADAALTEALTQSGIRNELVDLMIDENLSPGQFRIVADGAEVAYDLDAKLDEMISHLEEREQGFEDSRGQEE